MCRVLLPPAVSGGGRIGITLNQCDLVRDAQRHHARWVTHKQLSAYVGTYNLRNHRKNAIAHELELFGDFTGDLAVGDSISHA